MYIPKYYAIKELVSRSVFNDNEKNIIILWNIFDERILFTIDALRKKYGVMYANTWALPRKFTSILGRHESRGWRPKMSLIGAKFSQHKFGRAVDLAPQSGEVQEIRKDILTYDTEEFQYITCIERRVPWLHIDCRNHDKQKDGIKEIYP